VQFGRNLVSDIIAFMLQVGDNRDSIFDVIPFFLKVFQFWATSNGIPGTFLEQIEKLTFFGHQRKFGIFTLAII